jgi:hypothetical protein
MTASTYIVTCITIARQRVGKHIPATRTQKIGRLLLENELYTRSITIEDSVFRGVRLEAI